MYNTSPCYAEDVALVFAHLDGIGLEREDVANVVAQTRAHALEDGLLLGPQAKEGAAGVGTPADEGLLGGVHGVVDEALGNVTRGRLDVDAYGPVGQDTAYGLGTVAEGEEGPLSLPPSQTPQR